MELQKQNIAIGRELSTFICLLLSNIINEMTSFHKRIKTLVRLENKGNNGGSEILKNSRPINGNKLAKTSIIWENYGKIKGEKSQSKIEEVSTVLSKRPKEEPTFHQIQKAGKGQVAIIKLIILETVFGLAETAVTFPFPRLAAVAFTIMPKSKICFLMEIGHLL